MFTTNRTSHTLVDMHIPEIIMQQDGMRDPMQLKKYKKMPL